MSFVCLGFTIESGEPPLILLIFIDCGANVIYRENLNVQGKPFLPKNRQTPCFIPPWNFKKILKLDSSLYLF